MNYLNRTTGVFAAAAALACSAALFTGQARAEEKQLTVAMITHAQPGDTFWDIIRKGAEAAAKKDNVKLIYLADPTANKEAQLISNVVQQHVDGIALTLAFPDAEAPAVKAAQKAGIPIVGFNAGVDQWKSQDLLGYAGQDETVAGKAVGERLNKEGAKDVVCLDQQQGAVQLEARCDGIKDTFKGKMEILYVTGYDMPTVKARVQAKLQQDPSIDYVVTLGAPFAPVVLDAITASSSKAKVGTFDMSPVAIDLIGKGKIRVGGRPAALCRGLRGGRHAVALPHQRGHRRWRRPGADRPLLRDQGKRRGGGQVRQGRHALRSRRRPWRNGQSMNRPPTGGRALRPAGPSGGNW